MKQTILFIDSIPKAGEPAGSLQFIDLTWDERCKSKHRAITDGDVQVALSLPRGTSLAHGTLVYDSPDLSIAVRAKPEPVLAIYPGGNEACCKVAHHLGNWHRSIQVAGAAIYAHPDAPLEDWLKRQGVPFERKLLPFEPNLRCHAHD